MKNFYIVLLITVILLSGCSKNSRKGSAVEAAGVATAATSQSAGAGVYAYIPYWSGRIDSYSVADGKFTKTGEVRVGGPIPPVADPTGKYLYIADNKAIITRFAIGADGVLTDPVAFKPNLNNQYVNDLVMAPSGKWLYLTSIAGDLDGNVIGSINRFNVAADGTLTQAEKVEFSKGINMIDITPTEDYLLVRGRSWMRSYKIGNDGSLTEAKYTNSLSGGSTVMSVNADGSSMLIDQTGGEQSFLAYCSIQAGEVKKLSEVVIPAVFMPIMVSYSVATDGQGNVLLISGNDWLSTYSLAGSQLKEVNHYVNYRDHKWTTRSEAEAYLPSTSQYAARLHEDSPNTLDKQKDALYGAMAELSSYLATVRLAPDGNIYVSSTSGVYRFKSTADGTVYDGPAISWPDTTHLFRGITQASHQEKRDAQPIADGMIFVQRK